MALGYFEVENVAGVLGGLLGGGHGTRFWFRGQGCDSRKLLPSLYRRMAAATAAGVLDMERRLIIRFRQRSFALVAGGLPAI